MQKEVIDKINLLVEMSGTPNNYDTLEEELHLLEKKIEKQKEKVRNLKKSVAENSYIKSSDRIIDENIKIGIENKIEFYNGQLAKIESQIAKQLKEEQAAHDEVTSYEQEKNELTSFLKSLELKIKTIGSKDKTVYDFYVKLIDETKDNINRVNESLKEARASYESFCEMLERLGNNREDLTNKMASEKERLEEINRFLANPNSYIDQTAKQSDEKMVDELMDELEEMEHRKREILKDPAYLSHEAITYLIGENYPGALMKIKEIVNYLLELPYMDTDNRELSEILENATNKRDDLANEIENKNYESQAMEIVDQRVNYLTNKKKELEQKILLLRDTIKKMDVEEIKQLLEAVSLAKKTREQLKDDMKEYQQVIEANKEFKTPKKEASLRAAYKKKEEEYNFVDKIVLSFEKDLEGLVLNSSKLEEQDLVSLEEQIKEIDKEIKELKKAEMMRIQTKDILAVEKDKETLKELNDDVEHIKQRQKYNQKPSEIFDEIELSIGSINTLPENKEEPKEDYVDLNDYRISLNPEEAAEEVPSVTNEAEITLEPPKVEPPKEEVIEEIPEPVILEETEELSLPEEPEIIISDVSKVEEKPVKSADNERFKVISVEPLDIAEPPKAEENKPIETNLPEDEYISFNNLLEEDETNENSN